MEELFAFMFGAGGRIGRAEYWRSLIIFSVAGLFAAVILLTAAGLAAPLFILALAVVVIPWLLWGFAIHTERLHDRGKSAWWLLLFYGLPMLLSYLGNVAVLAGTVGHLLQPVLALASLALSLWGFVEIGFLPGIAGANRYGPNPPLRTKRASY